MADFTSKKLTKGRITNARTGVSKVFSINPHTVKTKNGVHLTEDPIPGFSDALLRFAAGKARDIRFTLDIDGEMTLRKIGVQTLNVNQPERDVYASFSISGEIEWYESFTFPVDPTLAGSDGGLDIAIFSMGTHLNGIQCFIEEVETEITEWDPTLEPTKAKLHIVMKRIADENRFADTVWSGGDGGASVQNVPPNQPQGIVIVGPINAPQVDSNGVLQVGTTVFVGK